MKATIMTIGELADAAWVSRRAVRFYVQRGLLPPPLARGRGASYGEAHAERLQQILRLQDAGHSLAAIAALLGQGGASAAAQGGEPATAASSPPPAGALPAPAPPPRLRPQLVIHLRLADGIELQLDATRFNPDAGSLIELRDTVLHILERAGTTGRADPAAAPTSH
jgi:DNA-binding transcriptional MerR regulator